MRKFANLLVMAAIAGAWASGACAHAALERASPPVGGAVSGSPGEVRLWFSGALARGSSAEVSGPSGRVGGRAAVSGRELAVRVPRLAPGAYRVNWHAVSADGHATEGSFAFEVKP